MFRKLFCFLGFHDYEPVSKEKISFPKKGEMLNVIKLHKCSKCGKEKMIGSGLYV